MNNKRMRLRHGTMIIRLLLIVQCYLPFGETMLDDKFDNSLNGILKENALTRRNGRVASDRTTTSYGEVLRYAFSTLFELGFKLQNPANLTETHVGALCRHWHSTGKKPSTIQDYLSKLRIFSGWVGKKGMVKSLANYLPEVDKKLLRVSKIAGESKGWSEHGVDIKAKIQAADELDWRFGLMLRMMLAFGLRRKEVVHNRPWKADRGDKLVIYIGEAKGGRPRDIIFDTTEQRHVLNYVKSKIGKSEYLGWPTTTRGEAASLKYNISKYNKLMAKIGITKLKDGVTGHGLRAQYAENSALIAGMIPATLGGTKGQMDSELLDVTRAQISEQLGHSRISVTAAYYGSFGRDAKPDEVNRCKLNIERGIRATATMQLKPVPQERMADCIQLVAELDALDIGATTKQAYFLWTAHSARFGSEWVVPQAGNAEAMEVQALKLTSDQAQVNVAA